MSNLIVTILAIGLAGAMGLAAVFYGGGGYMEGQARAKATRYANYLTQISGAVDLWSQRNGATFPRPSANYPAACSNGNYCSASDLQTLLGTRYLSNIQTPTGADASMAYYWNETSSWMESPVFLLRLGNSSTDLRTCYSVEAMRSGTVPSALRTHGANVNAAMCGKIGCFANDGTFGSAVTYPYIIYERLNGTPDKQQTDYNGTSCPPTGTETTTPLTPDPAPSPTPDPSPGPGPAPVPSPPAPAPSPPSPSPPAPSPPSPTPPSPTPPSEGEDS